MDKTSLGDRMKKYERLTNFSLLPRTPIILRLDGKNFSSFTRSRFKKPWDKHLSEVMEKTMLETAKMVQDCVFGYTQSDEITLVIRPEPAENSERWFDGRIQKMCSIAAAKATAIFNHNIVSSGDRLALFDCRVFSLPNEIEVRNCLIWRQRDCVKNSISSACYFDLGKIVGRGKAQEMTHKLNQNQRQELLFQHGINWNDYDPKFKNGIMCFREEKEVQTQNGETIRKPWGIYPATTFTSEDGVFLINVVQMYGYEPKWQRYFRMNGEFDNKALFFCGEKE